MSARYPFAPLAAAMGLSENQACVQLKVSGSTQQDYRRNGLSEKVADRLAVKAGLLPYEVWPEMAEAAFLAVSVVCATDGCDVRFVPRDRGNRYCSVTCRRRQKARRYRATQAGAENNRKWRRAWYQECREYDNATSRRRRELMKRMAA